MPKGGYRAGAGRPKGSRTLRLPALAAGQAEAESPLTFPLGIVNDASAPLDLRVRCAVAALPYCHPRAEPDGKKARDAAAEHAERGTVWEALLS